MQLTTDYFSSTNFNLLSKVLEKHIHHVTSEYLTNHSPIWDRVPMGVFPWKIYHHCFAILHHDCSQALDSGKEFFFVFQRKKAFDSAPHLHSSGNWQMLTWIPTSRNGSVAVFLAENNMSWWMELSHQFYQSFQEDHKALSLAHCFS